MSGYAYANRGIVTVHRGNVDSIYPNAPEAQLRRANGTFTSAPFLSPALALETEVAADFLGAGDFDADGHWDIVLARRGGSSLRFLTGDGMGNFTKGREVSLDGRLTLPRSRPAKSIDAMGSLISQLVSLVGVRPNARSV